MTAIELNRAYGQAGMRSPFVPRLYLAILGPCLGFLSAEIPTTGLYAILAGLLFWIFSSFGGLACWDRRRHTEWLYGPPRGVLVAGRMLAVIAETAFLGIGGMLGASFAHEVTGHAGKAAAIVSALPMASCLGLAVVALILLFAGIGTSTLTPPRFRDLFRSTPHRLTDIPWVILSIPPFLGTLGIPLAPLLAGEPLPFGFRGCAWAAAWACGYLVAAFFLLKAAEYRGELGWAPIRPVRAKRARGRRKRAKRQFAFFYRLHPTPAWQAALAICVAISMAIGVSTIFGEASWMLPYVPLLFALYFLEDVWGLSPRVATLFIWGIDLREQRRSRLRMFLASATAGCLLGYLSRTLLAHAPAAPEALKASALWALALLMAAFPMVLVACWLVGTIALLFLQITVERVMHLWERLQALHVGTCVAISLVFIAVGSIPFFAAWRNSGDELALRDRFFSPRLGFLARLLVTRLRASRGTSGAGTPMDADHPQGRSEGSRG